MSATFSPTTVVPAGKVHTWEYLKKTGVPIAMFLGAYQAVIMRQWMSPDGVAYLDMGDRIWNEGWFATANGYWSPLYPTLLGGVLKLFHPSMYHEFALVHVVNVGIYALALCTFQFFWKRTIAWMLGPIPIPERNSRTSWVLFGYSVVVWASLSFGGTGAVTPDLLVGCFIYIAAGIVAVIHSGDREWRNYVVLGTVLGLAYLAKAAMFPIAFVFLIVALLIPGNIGRSTPRILVSTSLFLAISALWIVPISRATGHPTFGETGRMNYAWYVNAINSHDYFPAGVQLSHPVKLVSDDPPLYQFTGPIRGSYPFWTDPSYWLAGVKPHFSLAGQERAFVTNIGHLLMLPGLLVWSAVLLFLILLAADSKTIGRNLIRGWALLLPSAAAVGMYTLVLLEGRYVGPFLTVLLATVLITIFETYKRLLRSVIPMLAISAVVLVATWVLVDTPVDLIRARNVIGQDEAANLQVAVALKQNGLREGASVGSIGDSFRAYWVRLDRLRVVAEITDTSSFWAAEPARQAQVIEAFRRTGARAIIADNAPKPNPDRGWHRLSKTHYYIFDLQQPETNSLSERRAP